MMLGLLQADFYRVKRSKLFLISLILTAAFPLFTCLVYFGVEQLSFLYEDEMSANLFSFSTVVASTFSLGNNIGLIIPIFSSIFVCMDISNGTLRNKVIVGQSRQNIYLSHLIVSACYNLIIITIYCIFNIIFGGIFFGFDFPSFTQMILFIITGEFSFLFVACISTFYAMMLKSTAPSIIITVVTTIAIYFITSILTMINYEPVKYIIYFIPLFSNSASALGFMEMPLAMFWEGIASYFVFGSLLTILGISIFKSKDIK